MSYLYTPPMWRHTALFPEAWALIYGFMVSTCVYRLGGVWTNIQTPGMDNPVVADCDRVGDLLLFFDRPTVVPDSLHDELAALEAADPSWTDPTLEPA